VSRLLLVFGVCVTDCRIVSVSVRPEESQLHTGKSSLKGMKSPNHPSGDRGPSMCLLPGGLG